MVNVGCCFIVGCEGGGCLVWVVVCVCVEGEEKPILTKVHAAANCYGEINEIVPMTWLDV